ncbi:MAG: hypothetical protein EA365_15395 [Gloeocapsa sp. DLM2.Bin57]|nr:MAG: hypothetical protein EA365_15395 [Gloeocapsa sp. DLM2.Bin57]
MNLDNIQQEIAALPPEAQQTIFDLVEILQKRYLSESKKTLETSLEDWSDFIGYFEAETDLSTNYKTYLKNELDEKYDYR